MLYSLCLLCAVVLHAYACMHITQSSIVLRKATILQPSVVFEKRAASVLLYNSSCEITAEWSYKRMGM